MDEFNQYCDNNIWEISLMKYLINFDPRLYEDKQLNIILKDWIIIVCCWQN
jgi:hypothetical protein